MPVIPLWPRYDCPAEDGRSHNPMIRDDCASSWHVRSSPHSCKALSEKVLKFKLDTSTTTPYFPTDIAEAIHQLWKDPIIPKIMDEHSSKFYLIDPAA